MDNLRIDNLRIAVNKEEKKDFDRIHHEIQRMVGRSYKVNHSYVMRELISAWMKQNKPARETL